MNAQFIMEDSYADEFRALDEFTRGYIECLFFTESGDGELEGYGFLDLAPETLKAIIEDCHDFQQSFAGLLDKAYESPLRYDAAHAGHDFWLTRNGHGAGFWDRGLGQIGKLLTDMSKPYGSTDAYLGDDSKVYLS